MRFLLNENIAGSVIRGLRGREPVWGNCHPPEDGPENDADPGAGAEAQAPCGTAVPAAQEEGVR